MFVNQDNIAIVIKRKLEEFQDRNSSFSLRAMASKLEMNSGGLSLIINKKRNITKKQAEELSKKLNLTKDEEDFFLESFKLNERLLNPKIHHYEQCKGEETDGVPSCDFWIVFAILNLIEHKDVEFNARYFSKRLEIEEERISNVMKYLLKENLLYWNDDGKVVRSNYKLSTSDNVKNDYIKKSHATNLKLALEKLEVTSLAERDYTSLTFSIRKDRIDIIKKLTREYQDKLMAIVDDEDADSVYKMNFQLFPLTID